MDLSEEDMQNVLSFVQKVLYDGTPVMKRMVTQGFGYTKKGNINHQPTQIQCTNK